MLRRVLECWRELTHSLLSSFGVIFLTLEAFEVVTDHNIKMPFALFLAAGVLLGLSCFLLDGYRFSGFLRREVKIPVSGCGTKITVKFGDLFKESGWKAIAVNDFFDSIVDEDLVSSKSMHGHVLNTYWCNNWADWEKQVTASLQGKSTSKEARSKGNQLRYEIGATARAVADGQKFLFVALGKTNPTNNVTSANTEMLIRAVRGMVAEARAACSMEPLVIPLMGSGLSRVAIKNSALVDLIITAVLEESSHCKVTGEIKIVLPEDMAHHINLKNHIRNWTYGK